MKLWEDPTVVREAAAAAMWLYTQAATSRTANKRIATAHYAKLAALLAALIVNATNLMLGRGEK